MAEVKITELTEFTNPASDDLFVAVDGSVTKKITYGNIESQISGAFDINGIQEKTGKLIEATGELAVATGSLDIGRQLLTVATGELSDFTGRANSLERLQYRPTHHYVFTHTGALRVHGKDFLHDGGYFFAASGDHYHTWHYEGQAMSRFTSHEANNVIGPKTNYAMQIMSASVSVVTNYSDRDIGLTWTGQIEYQNPGQSNKYIYIRGINMNGQVDFASDNNQWYPTGTGPASSTGIVISGGAGLRMSHWAYSGSGSDNLDNVKSMSVHLYCRYI